ncbi:MAG: protein kinase [Acidobacteria bacterium]|nr:protein kinase [Acidobacteriota bacterium]MCA1638924.1 protein kinase [Acidobacteriota bacterium]
MSRLSFESGTHISHYRIVTKIGAGGMGEVYLAEDTKLDRKVAIKFLNEEFSKDADKLNRFVQEAKAVSALNHPNILTVYEIGENDDSNYIVNEFIEGKTLREHLSPRETNSLNSILKIAVQVAEALSAAHQAGIIHRDIKPENIMIRSDGYAKVLDFGLAKLTEQKQTNEISLEGATKAFVKTNPGMVMGTVQYMSPEQARGKETDARTDFWSLGVVLYEMLAGKVPFAGETINHTIVSILEKEPKLLENVPDELQRIVRKTLTKDVDMRYQSARDLLIDLKNLRRDLDIQGELERSIVPNRKATTNQVQENETQIYSSKSIEETKAESKAKATQNVTTSSSLEYAVTQARSNKLATAIVCIILLGAISAIAYFGFFAKSNTKQIESIAVMPFVNESGNADVEYLSDGMTEMLISSLSQLPKLNVKARSSVFRYKGKEKDAQTIGKELSVQAILTGKVVQRGNDLSLYVELVDVASDKVIWSETYNRPMINLVALQKDIARDVSNNLQTKLSGADKQRLAKSYTQNTEAYQLYLKGRFYWNKRTPVENRKAVEYFEQAIALDPTYALAYAALADCYILQLPSTPRKERFPKARAAAMKALEIDETLGEAHTALAEVEVDAWNWSDAERGFKRAIELSPNYPTARHWHAELLSRLGRHDEAITEIKRAQELDPLSLPINTMVGHILMMAHRFDQAIEQYKKTLEMDPNFNLASAWLTETYIYKGMYEEAITEAEKRIAGLGGNPDNRATQVQNFAELREAYRKAGAKGFWEQDLKHSKQRQARGENVQPHRMAEIYANLGDKEQAFEWFEKVIEDRGGDGYIKVDPAFDPLRDDPRFQELLEKVGFPP